MTDKSHGMRLVIAGGGTGGHVLPALAVLEELSSRDVLADALWIGSREGVERQTAEDAGIHFVEIPTGTLRRYVSLRNLTDAARVPLGIHAARRTLQAFHPTVILSTGGFVSVPTVVAARSIAPVLTHEQTAILGLATRINARFADVLAVSHAQTAAAAQRIHRHVVVTGNPVRPMLARGDRPRGLAWLGFDDALPVLFVTGGARGASPINRRIAAMLPSLLDHAQVVHQTGPAVANDDAASMSRLRDRLPDELRARYRVFPFIRDELPDVYATASLVIGRSGAGTIAELAFLGLPSILIPLPATGGDEQVVNARILADAGAGVAIPQSDASPDRLMSEIRCLLSDPQRRARMSDSARAVARPNAAADMADALIALSRPATTMPR